MGWQRINLREPESEHSDGGDMGKQVRTEPKVGAARRGACAPERKGSRAPLLKGVGGTKDHLCLQGSGCRVSTQAPAPGMGGRVVRTPRRWMRWVTAPVCEVCDKTAMPGCGGGL